MLSAVSLSEIVDIDAERGSDLLKGLDGPLSLAGIQLRDVRRSKTSYISQFLRGHAAIFAPNAELVFAVDDSVHDFGGDQFILASGETLLCPVIRAHVG